MSAFLCCVKKQKVAQVIHVAPVTENSQTLCGKNDSLDSFTGFVKSDETTKDKSIDLGEIVTQQITDVHSGNPSAQQCLQQELPDESISMKKEDIEEITCADFPVTDDEATEGEVSLSRVSLSAKDKGDNQKQRKVSPQIKKILTEQKSVESAEFTTVGRQMDNIVKTCYKDAKFLVRSGVHEIHNTLTKNKNKVGVSDTRKSKKLATIVEGEQETEFLASNNDTEDLTVCESEMKDPLPCKSDDESPRRGSADKDSAVLENDAQVSQNAGQERVRKIQVESAQKLKLKQSRAASDFPVQTHAEPTFNYQIYGNTRIKVINVQPAADPWDGRVLVGDKSLQKELVGNNRNEDESFKLSLKKSPTAFLCEKEKEFVGNKEEVEVTKTQEVLHGNTPNNKENSQHANMEDKVSAEIETEETECPDGENDNVARKRKR